MASPVSIGAPKVQPRRSEVDTSDRPDQRPADQPDRDRLIPFCRGAAHPPMPRCAGRATLPLVARSVTV